MGTAIGDLIVNCRKQITIDELRNKTIGFDAYNIIYAFLSRIRNYQQGGDYFTDNSGNITSHLIGLFPRMLNLLAESIKPVFIFDGKPPDLKTREIEDRRNKKEQALLQQETAKAMGDLEEAMKYAMRTSSINTQIVNDTKLLLEGLGIPSVMAPSEAEAQGAYMVREKKLKAFCSQDYDSFLFGCPVVIRNLTISQKKKIKDVTITIRPEMIRLNKLMMELKLESREQLIMIGLMIGTDYNPAGIKGIGPKTALKLVKKYPDRESLFSYLKSKYNFDEIFPTDPNIIIDYFIEPTVDTAVSFKNKPIDDDKIIEFLVEQRGFSIGNVERQLEKYRSKKKKRKKQTKKLDGFFK